MTNARPGLRFAPASRPEPLYPGWPAAAEFSLIVLGMLLFSERTWKHHCVTLMLPFAVLTYYLATRRPRPLLGGYLIASLVVAVVFMSLTSTPGLSGFDQLAKKAEIYGAYVWAYVVLAAALASLLRTPVQPQACERQPITVGG